MTPAPEFVTENGNGDVPHQRGADEDLGGLQRQFASFVTAHTVLSERRDQLRLELRGVEAQLVALTDRAQRVGSLLDGAPKTDVNA